MIRLRAQVGSTCYPKRTARRPISEFIPLNSGPTSTFSENCLPLPSNELLTNTSSSFSFDILSRVFFLHLMKKLLTPGMCTTSSFLFLFCLAADALISSVRLSSTTKVVQCSRIAGTLQKR